jgi:hypothetical protein
MAGPVRTQLLVEYIAAVERGVYQLPANTSRIRCPQGDDG